MSANTFPWIEHKEAALRLWYQFLKPGGLIGIHTPADTAYVGQAVLRKVFERYGVTLEPTNRIGAIESVRVCLKMLALKRSKSKPSSMVVTLV